MIPSRTATAPTIAAGPFRYNARIANPPLLVACRGDGGGGAAYYRARRGQRVTVVARGDIGGGASSGHAGIIAIGHPPLPRPGLPGRVLRWMLDGGSPLYLPPRLDPAMFRWF